MAQAVELATGLKKDEMITWWVGNDGTQKVKITASDALQDDFYRVYLTWTAHEGWLPTKVDVLKENDIDL